MVLSAIENTISARRQPVVIGFALDRQEMRDHVICVAMYAKLAALVTHGRMNGKAVVIYLIHLVPFVAVIAVVG